MQDIRKTIVQRNCYNLKKYIQTEQIKKTSNGDCWRLKKLYNQSLRKFLWEQ